MDPHDFERVVVIGLRRRPDRLQRFWSCLPAPWPCRQMQHVPAIDGANCEPPDWYRPTRPQDQGRLWKPYIKGAPNLAGAWGCLRTHYRIWEDCLNDRINSVLVFEDDAVFCPRFTERLTTFLDAVPDDWDMVYLGGQHLGTDNLWPQRVNSHVLRGRCVNRTHAYAVRQPLLTYLYTRFVTPWASADPSQMHIDHQLCRVHREWDRQERRYVWGVYCPSPQWLVGQAEGISDVKLEKPGREHWWNEFKVCDVEPQERELTASVPG